MGSVYKIALFLLPPFTELGDITLPPPTHENYGKCYLRRLSPSCSYRYHYIEALQEIVPLTVGLYCFPLALHRLIYESIKAGGIARIFLLATQALLKV